MTLLDDEALQKELQRITTEHSCYGCYDEMKSQRRKCPGLQVELVRLIQSQKQAWADEVIGKDDNLSSQVREMYRSELRAEQRERNKL